MDRRGDALEEWLNSNQLSLINQELTHTWSNYRSASVLDLTIVSNSLEPSCENWQVRDGLSDHRMVLWDLKVSSETPPVRSLKRTDWAGFTRETEKPRSSIGNLISESVVGEEQGLSR